MTKAKTPRQINAERKREGKLPLNFAVLKRVATRIEAKPRGYDQGDYKYQDDESPCGTVCCIAGEILICSKRSERDGLDLLHNTLWGRVGSLASDIAGLTARENSQMFGGGAQDWPNRYRNMFQKAATYKGRARAAVRYLRSVIATGQIGNE